MWFIFSIIALICWSGSDFFSKIGCMDMRDKNSHFKMVIAVGFVMGLHAAYEIFINDVAINFDIILTYLPVSLLYIISMVFGYVGLRYIELSVSSPICNSSGAVAALLCILFLNQEINSFMIGAIVLIGLSVLGLGVVEMLENDESRALRQQKSYMKYSKSALALVLPLLYCLIDALGTFFDAVVLREEPTGTRLDKLFPSVLAEDSANVAYELTFLFMGVLAAIYVFAIKKEKIFVKKDGAKLVGGIFETAGQFGYIFALADTKHAAPAAAIISAYCAISAVWSSIFLKERLSYKHYIAIAGALIGIIALGFLDP